MKATITIVLSAYIAIVSCSLCSNVDGCVEGNVLLAGVAISPDEHSEEEFDLCSPFCICSCCSSSINQLKDFGFTVLFPHIIDQNSHVRSDALKSVLQSIWQPPRIV